MLIRWAVVIVVGVALIGATLASAASISLGGADDLGSGSADVVAPAGVVVTDVEWTLLDTDTSRVVAVTVTFATPTGGDDCLAGASDGCVGHFALKDSSGNVLVGANTNLAQLTINPFELSTAVPATNVKSWAFNGANVAAADVAFFAITVIDPN